MGRAASRVALRPFLPADAPLLAVIFRASIEDLTVDDYDDDQRRAWSEVADDETLFGAKLAQLLTIVATVDGAPAGFGALKGNDRIEMLYVHPALAGQGVGTMLSDALEKIGRGRGADQLSVDASDTARAFFEHRGFGAQQRNIVPLNGEWLANTTLVKRLGPAEGTS